ncbi:MAG: hypothetical protein JWQ47_1737, partial [Glaciihabitans sp.]|nr:hypothetical protein [Glaciihabitans sp.]
GQVIESINWLGDAIEASMAAHSREVQA